MGGTEGKIRGNPRYRGVHTAAAGIRSEPAARVGAAGRPAGHRELHAAEIVQEIETLLGPQAVQELCHAPRRAPSSSRRV